MPFTCSLIVFEIAFIPNLLSSCPICFRIEAFTEAVPEGPMAVLHIVYPLTFIPETIWESHGSCPVDSAILVLTFVTGLTIRPYILTMSMSLIIEPGASVYFTRFEDHSTVTDSLAILPESLVQVAISVLDALACCLAVAPVTMVVH